MLSIDFRQIAIVAGKEFWDRIRNRWVLAVALVFTAFALVISPCTSSFEQPGTLSTR